MSTKEEIEELANKLSEHFANEILDHPRVGAIAGGAWLGQREQELESLIYGWICENVRDVRNSPEL